MAQITREVLNATGMSLSAYCGGLSNIGIGVTGTWVGTVAFYGSTDGLNFFTLSLTPFASGTAVNSITANGNYFTPASNLIAVRVVFTRTSGSAQVNIAVANDASWQDAFLTQIQIYNNSSTTSGTNTLTQASQTNRAWNLTDLDISIAGPSWAGGTAKLTIYDGTVSGNVFFSEYLSEVAGSVGRLYNINLPTGADGVKSLVNTPGNAMTIVVSGLPSQACSINARFSAA